MAGSTQPSKEQVRAYMRMRESGHCPPPAPEEVRRCLGWRYVPVSQPGCGLLFPSALAQLSVMLAVEWYVRAAIPLDTAPLQKFIPFLARK